MQPSSARITTGNAVALYFEDIRNKLVSQYKNSTSLCIRSRSLVNSLISRWDRFPHTSHITSLACAVFSSWPPFSKLSSVECCLTISCIQALKWFACYILAVNFAFVAVYIVLVYFFSYIILGAWGSIFNIHNRLWLINMFFLLQTLSCTNDIIVFIALETNKHVLVTRTRWQSFLLYFSKAIESRSYRLSDRLSLLPGRQLVTGKRMFFSQTLALLFNI